MLRVSWDGRSTVALGNGKPAALLAYLALSPGPHRRDALAEMFWPGQPKDVMRLKLRQAIVGLRNALIGASDHSWLVSTRHTLAFDHAREHRIDALELIEVSEQPWPPDTQAGNWLSQLLAQMNDIADAYRRPFLSEMDFSDCPPFTQWQLAYREALQQRALELLAKLADSREQIGHPRSALPFALRITELDPTNEAGYWRTMALYALNAQPEAAMRQYETCRRVLEREFAGLPSRQLREFAERISSGEFQPLPALAPMPLEASEQHRNVTVVFCQLTAVAADDAAPGEGACGGDDLQQQQALARRIATEYSGHPVEYYGGGLLVFFGYPDALRSCALSAVRAAYALVALATDAVEIRVGVHTGLIITAPDSLFPDPVGLTSGVAIRLHRQARSGEIIISAQTRQGVNGFIPAIRLDTDVVAHGLAGSPNAFRVLPDARAANRLAAGQRLTPLIGRDRELSLLQQLWSCACNGRPSALLLRGEAGVGKSRLVTETISTLDHASAVVWELRCYPWARQAPLQPLLECIERACGLSASDGLEQKREKARSFLQARAPQLFGPGLALLLAALGLADVQTLAPTLPAAERLRSATEAFFVDLFLAIAASEPLLLVVEDLHWAGSATLAILASLVARAKGELLLLFTARAEFEADWAGLKTANLRRLRNEASDLLVRSINPDLPPARVDDIVARAAGIPVFLEALAVHAGSDELPASLVDLLEVRLSRLGGALAVAQLAATLGHTFEPGLLANASGLPMAQLHATLVHLGTTGMLQRLADGRWQFSHGLVQAVTYQFQSDGARQVAHRRIAEVIESQAPQRARDYPHIMALHWGVAGEGWRAVHYGWEAAERALRLFAFNEAREHCHSGLRLLKDLPPGAQRNGCEFAFLVGLARAEHATHTRRQHRGLEYLERAIALHEAGAAVCNGLSLFNALWDLWEITTSRQGFREGSHIALHLVSVAEREAQQTLLQQAHYALGNSLFWCGELALSRRHLDLSLGFEPTPPPYEPARLTRDYYGHITLVTAGAYSFLLRWLEGWTDKAIKECQAALTLARECGDALSLAFVTTFAAFMHRWEGNVEETRRFALEGREWSVASSFHVFTAANTHILGWADVMQGDAAAMGHLKRGLDTLREARRGVAVALLAPFAEALLHLNDVEQAGVIIDEAIERSTQLNDLHFLAELMRLKGHCLHRAGHHGAALASMDRAITISQRQGARQLELRARASRTRLGDIARG